MMRHAILIVLVAVAGCRGDESPSGFALTDRPYILTDLNGALPPARASIEFRRGRIIIEGPCWTSHAVLSAPYPWWEMTDLHYEQTTATAAQCDLAAEDWDFVQALGEMTISEVSGDILILSNTGDGRMVFQAE